MSPEVRELSSLPFSTVRVGALAAGAISAQTGGSAPCPAELWEGSTEVPQQVGLLLSLVRWLISCCSPSPCRGELRAALAQGITLVKLQDVLRNCHGLGKFGVDRSG